MAVNVEPTKVSSDLGVIVNGAIASVKKARSTEQARKEAEFQRAIADGLAYEEQVKFRENQLAEENKSSFSDNEYILKLEKSIADTKKLARFSRYRQRYADTLSELSSGRINEQVYLDTLKSSLNGVTDPDLRTEIQNDIATAEKNMRDYRKAILTNRVKKAQFDGTSAALNDAIASVRSSRAQALISDNEDEVTAYDETLSALESQLFGVRVQDALSDFQVQSSTRGTNPIEKLSFINTQLANADANRPIKIGNVPYRSAQEFWNLERNGFLSGSSQTFGDFFGELKNYADNQVNSAAVRTGFPPQAVLDDVLGTFNSLKLRPELAPFVNNFDNIQAGVMSNAVDKFAKKVADAADATQQYEFAINQLKNVGERYGVNTEVYTANLFDRIRGLENAGLITEGTAAGIAPKINLEVPEIKKPEAPKPTVTPAPVGAPTAPAGVRVVQAGDTLGAIAAQAGLSLAQVLAVNPQFRANPDLIRPGDQISLPTIAPEKPTAPAPTVTPEPVAPTSTAKTTPEPAPPAPAPVVAAAPAPTVPALRRVVQGDTLSGIAADAGVTLQQILDLNPQYKSNPNLIRPGEDIKLK